MSTTAALVKGHYRVIRHCPMREENSAECECGVKFSWENREEEHARHVLSEVWKDGVRTGGRYGHDDGWGFDIDPFEENPYEERQS